MKRVRVLLVGLPKLLQSMLLANYQAEEDLDLICWTGNETTLPEAIREHRPDVLIADGERDQLVSAIQSIADCAPDLKLVVINDHGRQAWMYEFSPTRTDLGEPSWQSLIQTVRGALGYNAGESS